MSGAAGRDPRLPPPGTVLVREHGGRSHRIEVLAEGFSYDGRRWRSLSAIAHHVTGTVWNGLAWVGLLERPAPADQPPPAEATAEPPPVRRRAGRPIAPRRSL